MSDSLAETVVKKTPMEGKQRGTVVSVEYPSGIGDGFVFARTVAARAPGYAKRIRRAEIAAQRIVSALDEVSADTAYPNDISIRIRGRDPISVRNWGPAVTVSVFQGERQLWSGTVSQREGRSMVAMPLYANRIRRTARVAQGIARVVSG